MGKTYTNRNKKKHKQDFSRGRKRKASRFEDEVTKPRRDKGRSQAR